MGTERDAGREPRSDAICMVYESHGQDARYNYLGEVCETISAKYGLGGGNVPIVIAYTPTSYGQYSEGIGTLRASGGDYGGAAR